MCVGYGFRPHTTTSPTGFSFCGSGWPGSAPQPVTRNFPSGDHATDDTGIDRAWTKPTSVPSFGASRITRSGPLPEPSDTAAAIVLSAGEIASALTRASVVRPLIALRHSSLPVAASHTITTPFSSPDAMILPSFDHATAVTRLSCRIVSPAAPITLHT